MKNIITIFFILIALNGHTQTYFQYDTKGNTTMSFYTGNDPCEQSNARQIPDTGTTSNQAETNSNATAVTDESRKSGYTDLSVYPNPSSDILNVEYRIKQDQNVRIGLYDLSGQQQAEIINTFQVAGNYYLSFDMTDLPTGIYTCFLQTDTSQESVKVVKVFAD